MTEKQLHALLVKWQRRLSLLGIGHWRFTVNLTDHIEDEVDDDPQARAEANAYYDDVEFHFKREAVATREKEGTMDELVVHEWLHVAARDHDRLVRNLMEYLPKATQEDAEANEEAAREGYVDRLARLIVSLHN